VAGSRLVVQQLGLTGERTGAYRVKVFKDNEAREWTVTITVATVKRVKALAGVDLMTVLDTDLLQRLSSDAVLLVDTVYAICKPQIDQRKLTDEDFAEAMAGMALADAADAFLEEMVEFFPPPRRELLAKALGKMKTVEKMAIEAGVEKIDNMDIEKEVQDAMSGRPSGASPDSSASIPPI